MSPSPFLRTRTRALSVISFCVAFLTIALVWTVNQRASNPSNHAALRTFSTSLSLPDKSVISPAACYDRQ